MALDMDLSPAQPMSPAGMVRISNGSRQRCIWPVHLSGWLALGWAVERDSAITEPAGVPTGKPEVSEHVNTAALEPMSPIGAAPSAAEHASPSAPMSVQQQRRGRKPRTAEPADTADPEAHPAPVAAPTEGPAGESTSTAAEPSTKTLSSAGAAAASGFALPDDLLSGEF